MRTCIFGRALLFLRRMHTAPWLSKITIRPCKNGGCRPKNPLGSWRVLLLTWCRSRFMAGGVHGRYDSAPDFQDLSPYTHSHLFLPPVMPHHLWSKSSAKAYKPSSVCFHTPFPLSALYLCYWDKWASGEEALHSPLWKICSDFLVYPFFISQLFNLTNTF